MELNLSRPLAIFDLETTGIRVATDRIVEISIIRVETDNSSQVKTLRVNPGVPIPLDATLIHGISDEDVKDEPTFKELSAELHEFFKDCDLSGYNSNRFDIPLLVEEFLRADVDFDLRDRYFIDVQNIFHRMEPRNLRAAYKFYCDKELIDAHSAEADTTATFEILQAQIERYKDTEYNDDDGNVSIPIKNDMKALHDFSYNTKFVDLIGHIVFNARQEEVFNFGKHKGRKVEDVFKKEPQYFDWMMKAEFPLSTKKVISAIKKRFIDHKSF
ncbi:MAG: exonuclease domain-containing protein [Bacteroidota bacterium]